MTVAGHFAPLIESTFLPALQNIAGKHMVGVTATASGDGTTFVVNSLGNELARSTGKNVLVLAAEDLTHITAECIKNRQCFSAAQDTTLFQPQLRGNHHRIIPPSCDDRLKAIEILRSAFDYVLVDCPCLKVSVQALQLAPLLDGIIMVVAADSSRRDEIQRAQQLVELAKGNLLGFVLNKRHYPIPQWLYQRL